MTTDLKSSYLKCILERYPELPVENVQLLRGAGQNNDILILNDSIVFRFPRNTEVVDRLGIEKTILSRIQAGVPLAVPRPTFTSVGTRAVGQVFVGYQYIPGLPLTIEKLSALQPHHRRLLAEQAATFLKALHDFPTHYFGVELPVYDQFEHWADMYASIQKDLFPHMRPAARKAVAAHFEPVLERPELLAFKPRLRHGDFGPSNILYNSQTGKISGVIDFSSAGLGDPAVDLAAVSLYGDEFVSHLFPVYPELQAILPRARFYRGTFALQEALFGYREGDEEAFQSGMQAYR